MHLSPIKHSGTDIYTTLGCGSNWTYSAVTNDISRYEQRSPHGNDSIKKTKWYHT